MTAKANDPADLFDTQNARTGKDEPLPAWPIDWDRLQQDHEVAVLRADLAASSPASYTPDELFDISNGLQASAAEVEAALRADFESLTPEAQGAMLGMLEKADPGNIGWWRSILIGEAPDGPPEITGE